MSREVVIVAACRTPVGSFGGQLKDVKVSELGKIVMEDVIKRAGIQAEQIDEVIFGCVLQAAQGMNVARQASIYAGIPETVPAYTINKVCGSGLKSVSLAAQAIKAGDADIILAGGMENMSRTAYALDSARYGYRMSHGKMLDLMINDGLWDVFNDYHMGITAENIAEKYSITREEQDAFAFRSQDNAQKAIAADRFKEEIVPVVIKSRKGDIVFDKDEYPKATTVEKLGGLKPAFKKDGSVTAGNASGINDGAAAVLVMSKEKADELGLPIMATITSYASGGVDPKIMGMGPVPASQKALAKAGLKIEDMDLIEANEAFAAQGLGVGKELGFDKVADRINVNGGAIAIGHPIGASGTRILVTLLHEMQKRDAKKGLATLCIGGGQGIAMIVER